MLKNSPPIENILMNSSPLAGDNYKRGHILFKNATDQQDLVLDWVSELAGDRFSRKETVSICSIGAGTGIFDVAFIERMKDKIGRISYTGIEPNEEQVPVLQKSITDILPDNSTADIHACLFEDFSAEGKKFDVILSIHAHYFFDDISDLIRRACDHLSDDGVFILTSAGDSFLSKYFTVTFRKNFDHPAWLSPDVEAVLREESLPYEKHRIDARLDISPCFSANRNEAVDMLNYIVHADISQITDQEMTLLKEDLQKNAVKQGSKIVKHPVDAFIISRS